MRILNLFPGKTTFFVANQSTIDSIPPEKLATLETELKSIEEENTELIAKLRTHNSGKTLPHLFLLSTTSRPELAKLKTTPTDFELDDQITDATNTVSRGVLPRLDKGRFFLGFVHPGPPATPSIRRPFDIYRGTNSNRRGLDQMAS